MLNLVQLKNEIQADPAGLGYAAALDAGQDWKLAEMLNEIRPAISVPRADVTPLEIIEAIDVAHFKANLTVLHGSWFESLTQFPQVRILKDNGADTRVMSNLMAILTNGSASETRLRNLASRQGSRAEQLFGVGTSITTDHVSAALRS